MADSGSGKSRRPPPTSSGNLSPTYPNSNPAQSPPSPGYRRRLILVGVAVGGIVVLFTVIVVLWLWITAATRLPTFALASTTVSPFSVSSVTYGALLSADFNVTFTVYNPNKQLAIRYDKVVVDLCCRNASIATKWLPPIDQGARTAQAVTAQLVTDAALVGSGVGGGTRSDRAPRSAGVRFQVRVTSSAAFHVNRLTIKRRKVKVYCDGVLVRFDDAAAGEGQLVGPPRSCNVK